MLTALLFAAVLAQGPASIVTHSRDTYPSMSPDGSTLLFQSTRNGRWALYTTSPDGSDLRLLLDSGDDPVVAKWSPDGRQIAFAATVDGQSEVFVMNADGTGRRRLTDDPGDDSHPVWSSDGRIFFNSARTTPDRSAEWGRQWHEVFSMRADGSDLRQHTRCRAVCTYPAPSPDGRRLAYRKVVETPGRNWDLSASPRNSEVIVSDMDGGGEVNLSNHPGFDGWPVWSPDGAWLIFAANRGETPNVGQVWAVRGDGSGLHQVSHDDWSNTQPGVTPDGDILTYRHIEYPGRTVGMIARWDFAPPAA